MRETKWYELSFLRNDDELQFDLVKILLFAVFTALVLLLIAGLIGLLQAPNNFRFPDSEFWNSYGSAIAGIVGSAVGLVGALFGILLASLGLRMARHAEDRETYLHAKDSVEKSVEPLVALSLRFGQILRSVGIWDYRSLEKLQAMVVWLTIRDLAGATNDLGQGSPTATKTRFFELLHSYKSRCLNQPFGENYWQCDVPPIDIEEVLPVSFQAFRASVDEALQSVRRIEGTPSALLYLSVLEHGPHEPSPVENLHYLDSRLSSIVQHWDQANSSNNAWIKWFVQAWVLSWAAQKAMLNAIPNRAFGDMTGVNQVDLVLPFLRDGLDRDWLYSMMGLLPASHSFRSAAARMMGLTEQSLLERPTTAYFLNSYSNMIEKTSKPFAAYYGEGMTVASSLKINGWRDAWEKCGLSVEHYDHLSEMALDPRSSA